MFKQRCTGCYKHPKAIYPLEPCDRFASLDIPSYFPIILLVLACSQLYCKGAIIENVHLRHFLKNRFHEL